MPYNNNNCDCRMDDIEYTIVLNEQGPQGRQGRQGEDGFSPSITVSVDTPSTYQLTITTKDQVINTPNLKANIPDPTFDGAVLTVNEDAALGYAWQELPFASTEQRGTVQLATDSDLTPDPETGYDDVVPTIEQLADEITNRTTADTTLQANIDSEASTREAADTTLQTNIDNEASARQSADTTLQNNIDALEQSLDNGLATKQDTLTAGTNIEITSENVINNTYSYTLPQATAETLGAIKANARTEDDTQEVKIDTTTGILYTSPTGGTGGTNDYTELENKPSINNVTLQGNITLDQLGVQAAGNYVTTDTEQTISEKKTFTNGASLSFTSKLTADDGLGVNEYNIIYNTGASTYIGDIRLGTTIYTANEIDIERPDGDGTSTTYTNVDSGNLSEYAQPLLSNLATKDELGDYLTKTEAADTYATASEVDTLTSTVTGLETSKQDVLTAGANIQITNNTISATDTTYTAGDGITIEGNVISATGGSGELELEAQLPLEIVGTSYSNPLINYTDGDTFTVTPLSGSDRLLTPQITKELNIGTRIDYIGYNPQVNDRTITIDNTKLLIVPFKVGYKIRRELFSSQNNSNTLYGMLLGRVNSDGTFTIYHSIQNCAGGGALDTQVNTPSNFTYSASYLGKLSTIKGGSSGQYAKNGMDYSYYNPDVYYQEIATSQSGTTLSVAVAAKLKAGDTAASSFNLNIESPYNLSEVNAAIINLFGNTNLSLAHNAIYDADDNLVWSAASGVVQFPKSIKLNYDNTLTLNDNQLSVNTSGLNIPTATSDLTNDSGFITKDVNNLTNYTPTSGLATVATTGSYNDLTNKPSIPSEYTLPTATTTTLGGVKPDGSTITITTDGTISAVGGGGGSGDNYVTTDTVQDVGSYKTFTNGVYGRETAVTASTWEVSGGCLLGEHNSDTNTYIPYILKANPYLGGDLPEGLYIGNPTEGIPPNLVAYEEGGQGNYSYPQTFYHSTTGDNQSFPLLDTKNFEHFVKAGEGITITKDDVDLGYIISGSGAAVEAATLSGNNTFTGDNTFTGSVTVGGGTVVTASNVGTYAATTTQGTNADTAIANLNGFKFWSGSQAEYDGLASKDNTTLYIITGE